MTSMATVNPVKVFVLYRHLDGAWVWNRLVPYLQAGSTGA
jgi:hypothetical protein